jgi:hypothetical protein
MRALLGAALLAILLAPACRTPTEVMVEIDAEGASRADMSVAVQIDRVDRVETALPRVVTHGGWSAGGTVGTLGVVPSGDDDVVVRVVLATGREPSSCSSTDAAGCIVVRRRLRFGDGTSTRERIVLHTDCLGLFCDARSSCTTNGVCGSIDDDAPVDGGVVGAGDPYVAAVIADRPRHYYRLDEPPGATIAKDMMGRADGTYTGVELGVTGALKASADTGAFFDGTSSVSISGVDDLPGAFSIEAWARADTPTSGSRPPIVERIDPVGASLFGYRMSKPIDTDATFEVFRGARSFEADVHANGFGGYSHVVAVLRGGDLELWYDGQKAATTPVSDTTSAAVVGPFLVGSSRAGGSAFRGAIDEVAIYDYPLDPAQIQNHYTIAEALAATSP